MNQIICPHCKEKFTIDEKDYESIVKQIRDAEFEKQIHERERQFEIDKDNAIKLTKANVLQEMNEKLNDKDMEIIKLKNDITNFNNDKDNTIKTIKLETENEYKEEINKLNLKIQSLENDIKVGDKEYQIKEQSLKEKYDLELKLKDDQIGYYKDLKAKQSTKMIGETLEQHCNASFNLIRPMFSSQTYFEKDNDSRTGSKGDFVFKDYDEDGNEIISIMFEMKNEADETASKHKNEDFLKELDKDRKEKNCEYAVLVSLLEIDNETYNVGIVDMSHKYEKMYVIRPQFFIPIITMLRNAALKTMDYKRELMSLKSQNIDISNFEENMNKFKEGFAKNYDIASRKFNTAVEQINKTIKNLESIRDNLLASENQLRLANDKADSLTIRKLVKGNKTMAKLFADELGDEKLLKYANSLDDKENDDKVIIDSVENEMLTIDDFMA